jgi:cbb3-type cytochrome oxidase maturation protein
VEILYLLIPLSVALAFLIGAAFWWSVASGQFDDLEGPAHRILTDDDGWPASPHSRAASTPESTIDLHQDPGSLGTLTSAAWRSERDGAAGPDEPKERNR